MEGVLSLVQWLVLLVYGLCVLDVLVVWRRSNSAASRGLRPSSLAPVLCLLCRLPNVPMLALISATWALFQPLLLSAAGADDPLAIYLGRFALSWTAYFYMGNSNSLSTLDISVGYVGLWNYNPLLVGFQLLLSLYVGPLMIWTMPRPGSTVQTASNESQRERIFGLSVVLSMQSLLTGFCLLICILERHHLFIWSVFAPKLLYCSLHFVMLGLIVTVTLALQKCPFNRPVLTS